jgi:DNA uptake protein ComE-like DNA-binding protein
MNPLLQTVKQWFGFDRRERRSSFILLLLTIITFLLRYTIPVKNSSVEVMSSESGLQEFIMTSENEETGADSPGLFQFDPNNASFDTLKRLGLSDKQARTLISYRNKGGRFRESSDISKIFGIDEKTAGALIPYIKIKGDTSILKKKKDIYGRLIIELNRADSVTLRKLPGIGGVLSARIVKYRNLLGGYATIDQIKEVYGITSEVYNLVSGNLRVDTMLIKKIKINAASYRELIRFPYLDRYEVEGILKYREIKGPVSGLSELIKNKLITEDQAAKIKPYLVFDK